jgi:peptidoglycan/xylan/chitin deacetylase (PgdA/CDA1 family)
MWNGKKKAVTFSFDDGVMQDIRVIEILDKYGLKGTFNLNSEKFATKYPYETNGKTVERTIIEKFMV